MTDELLVASAKRGDVDATNELARRFEPVLRRIASGYFIPGGDQDDVVQEARVGLFKAIRDYDASTRTPFGAFASLCIRRQVITAVEEHENAA